MNLASFIPFAELFFLGRENFMTEEKRNFTVVGSIIKESRVDIGQAQAIWGYAGVQENGFEEVREQSLKEQNKLSK